MKIVQQERRTQGKTVIAHISDIHFNAKTDANGALFQALVNDVAQRNPDVIAVSGDVIDSSVFDNFRGNGVERACENVRAYLEDLCVQSGLKAELSLLVVPGNHDFRLSGLLVRRCQYDTFNRVFSAYYGHRFFPGLGLGVFCFNSNSPERSLNFGTGRVSEEDLVTFSRVADAAAEEHAVQWPHCTRVALVHHHPMPIPGTEHGGAAVDAEWFIVMKNAGMFLKQMLLHDVDLVLHGHKHYASYSRAAFPGNDRLERAIAVAAAGSVGKTKPRDPSYNLVTIHDTGEISLERRERPVVDYERRLSVPLLPYEDIRRRKIARRATQPQVRLHVSKMQLTEIVDGGCGDADSYFSFEGVTAAGEFAVGEIPVEVYSYSARFGKFHASSSTPGQNVKWEWLERPSAQGAKEAAGDHRPNKARIVFGPPLGSTPIDFIRKMSSLNTYCFNQQERLDTSKQKKNTENFAYTFTHLVDTACFQIVFPEGRMPKEFTLSVFDHRADRGEKPDDREREFARRGFSYSLEARTAILSLDHPLPGYKYKIEWNLPENEIRELNLNAKDAGLAEARIKALLKSRDDLAEDTSRRPVWQALNEFRGELAHTHAFKGLDADRELEISLFSYDENQHGLVCVCAWANQNPDSHLWKWVIPPGQTVNGRAYRRRETTCWYRVPGITCQENAIYEPSPHGEPDKIPPHTLVISIPLFHPAKNGRIVGILCFATKSLVSVLLDLANNRALAAALTDQSDVWHKQTLAQALGLATPKPPGP